MPDHRSSQTLKKKDLNQAINILQEIMAKKPTFLHCYAGIERSPLVCIGWLIKIEKITFQEAFEYLKSVHPATNPLSEQLNVLTI